MSFFQSFLGPFPDTLWEPSFLSEEAQRRLWESLSAERWEQPLLWIGGRSVKTPREVLWFGDVDYQYSGHRHKARALPGYLKDLKADIEGWLQAQGLSVGLNSVLLNRYRDGNDSIGMHSDDEMELGPEPVIASISLGAARTFTFEHKVSGTRQEGLLTPGSLLVMKGSSQKEWRHGIFKEPHRTGPRINLTFRHTFPRS